MSHGQLISHNESERSPRRSLVADDKEQLRIDQEPKRLLVTSEIYVRFTNYGYAPALSVMERRTKREYFMYVSARSLAQPLELMRTENGGRFTGLEFWVSRESGDKKAKYLLED